MTRLSVLALASLTLSAPAVAQVTVAPSVTFASPYVFRGAVFSRGLVVQPAVEARVGSAFVGVFGNIDPNGTATGNTFVLNEADLYAGVSHTVGVATLGATYTLYTFPAYDSDDDLAFSPTNEIALSARLNTPLSPGVTVAYDFDGDEDEGDLKGLYAEASVSHPLSVGTLPLTLGAAVGLDAGYLLPEGDTEVAHVTVSAASSIPFGGVTVSPKLGLQISVADAYRQAFAQPHVLMGGVTVGF